MGLFNKLKEILFDEETVEIPVITKNEKEESTKKKSRTSETKQPEATRSHRTDSDEVIIKKIETPKREIPNDMVDTIFDMPKLKDDSESSEPQKEKKINTFTFPVFNDDDKVETRRSDKKKKEEKSKNDHKTREKSDTTNVSASGYTNAYDYSYGKYKGDYMSSREENKDLLTKTLEKKEEHKTFRPSPIISPVYGVLNENYKKEDIISKRDIAPAKEMLDLDSVRRKAYGTLEDDIEASLTDMTREHENKEVKKEEIDLLEDDGISIDDLLVDDVTSKSDDTYEQEELEVVETTNEDMELFSVLDDDEPQEEIEIEPPKHEKQKEVKDFAPIKRREPMLDNDIKGPKIPDDVEELDVSKKEDKKESIKEEEDLFDLIDSLYEGKEEN